MDTGRSANCALCWMVSIFAQMCIIDSLTCDYFDRPMEGVPWNLACRVKLQNADAFKQFNFSHLLCVHANGLRSTGMKTV